MKKILIPVIALAFAAGIAGGIKVAQAADTNTNTPPPTNTNTNTSSGTVRRVSWGQLKVMYVDPPTTKNSE